MPGPEINKLEQYGEYIKGDRARRDLEMKLAHKSLDIPEDMGVNVTNTRRGLELGWREILAAGVVGATGLAFWMQPWQSPKEIEPTTTQQQGPIDTEYDVLFFDKDGNPITVPHIDTRPKEGDA